MGEHHKEACRDPHPINPDFTLAAIMCHSRVNLGKIGYGSGTNIKINPNLANSLTGILYGKSEFMRKSKEIVFM